MRKIILWMASIVSGVLCASEIYVGSRETKIITVSSGSEEVQSETVVVSSGARLVKDGEGALTLKTEAFAQDFPAALEVREGALTLKGSTVKDRTFSGVSAILAKAALHLDASDMDSLICNGDRVMEWLDTRETGSETDGYQYSRAVANTMAALIPELGLSDANLLPVKATVDGKMGIYFNGYKSGTWMNLSKSDGTQESLKLFNVFVVQAVVTEKGMGTMLGVNVVSTSAFTPGSATGSLSPLWQNPYAEAAGALASSRTYVNGAQIDPYNKGLPSGLCVMDVECLPQAHCGRTSSTTADLRGFLPQRFLMQPSLISRQERVSFVSAANMFLRLSHSLLRSPAPNARNSPRISGRSGWARRSVPGFR